MKKKDVVLILSVFAAAIVLFILLRLIQKPGDEVVVYLNNNEYARLALDEDAKLSINGTNTLVIHDGEAYMLEADCPDRVCINTGKISNNTQSIVCLPNGVVVTVERSE